jgi:hypothetical protein
MPLERRALTARRARGTKKPSDVMTCKHRAILIVTRAVEGTSTSVAEQRVELSCGEAEGHDGPHHDREHGERWDDRGQPLTHVLRHRE